MTQNSTSSQPENYSKIVCEKFRSAVFELRQTKSSWLEIAFACFAFAAAGWSIYQPYTSEWFEAPPLYVFTVFFGCGMFQVSAFMWRETELRKTAALVNGCMWLGVVYILFNDNVPGWMTSLAPVIMFFQAVIWRILDRHARTVPSEDQGR